MKKYTKEITIIIIQLLLFYLLPLTAGPTDVFGMIILLIICTFILSIIISIISKEKIKYFYPVVISILFIPSVYIYYNESALVHSIWYLIISYMGVMIGLIIKK